MDLQVYKSNGDLLLESSKLVYGLVKSGNLTQLMSERLRGEFNGHVSWVMPVYGFTVTAKAPIVFIHGRGVYAWGSTTGDSHTFYFVSANNSTQYYVFDLMRETSGGFGMRTYGPTGDCTFNSDQSPMNVVHNVSPPSPSTGRGGHPYGPAGRKDFLWGGSRCANWEKPLVAGRKYAAHLPFSRGARHNDLEFFATNGVRIGAAYMGIEGVFGGMGGITFMFCLDLGTYLNRDLGGYSYWDWVPTDRIPTASVVDVTKLPIPFSI